MSASSRTAAQRITGVVLDIVAFILLAVVLLPEFGIVGWWHRLWVTLLLMVAIRAIVIGHNVYEGLE